MSARRLVVTAAASLMVAACGVQPDAAPRDLPETEQDIAIEVSPAASDAAGANRIYLVAPGEEQLLRSVPRQAESQSDLIEILLAGPNDQELADQFSTFIPPSTELLSARPQGQVITIDLSGGISEISGEDLARAVGQIVYTASELDGIEVVQLRVDGEELAWPVFPSGETTSAPLQIYDYPNLVDTAQPDFPVVPAQT